MLGPPPMDLLERGARSKEFFNGEGETALAKHRAEAKRTFLGNWIAEIDVPQGLTSESWEENLEGEKKE